MRRRRMWGVGVGGFGFQGRGIYCVLAAAGSIAFTWLLIRGYSERSALLVSAAERVVDWTAAPAVTRA
ncbi:unnamed protein product [Lampetra fluviatilis]